MSEFTAREWSIQYDNLKKRIQNIRTTTGTFTSDEVKSTIATIGNLDAQLKSMNENPLRYEIVVSEIGRRQVLLDNLKKLIANGTIKENSPLTTGSNVRTGGARLSMDSKSSNGATQNPLTSDQALLQRQRDMMKIQDEMLLDIEVGVGRLHEKALVIGDEAKQHNRLLDDLDSNVDIATAALQAEAKHAEQIKEKAKVCWLYICIVVEVIILMLLLVLMFESP